MATETTGEHAEVAGACVDSAGGAVGMPQLCADWFPNQIFWLVVALVAIFFILSRVALPRIAAVLAERQGTITHDLAQAEELKAKAEEAEKAYEKKLADARTEAQRIVAEAKAEMQSELDAEIEKADAQIDEKLVESEARITEIRDGALEAIRTVAKDAAGEIVSVLGGNADAGALDSAVSSRVKG